MYITRLSVTFFVLFFLPLFGISAAIPQLEITQESPTKHHLTIFIPLPAGEALYADSLSFSVDHPAITLSEWQSSVEPISKYDTHFKQTKKLFTEPFSITIPLIRKDIDCMQARLHMIALSHPGQKHTHHAFPLQFASASSDTPPPVSISDNTEQPVIINSEKINSASKVRFSARIVSLFTNTESWALRLLLAALLGLLLSLTPCIYPMIPITVGILQAQGSRSMGRNFLISLSYIIGIATTFALLGITAAFTGKLFGSIMHNPLVIITIVTLLVYLAGSMLGLYELYLPSYFQQNHQSLQGGSLISTFLFGAVSGTVASPCLSPGLVLLLTMVTALKSALLGFALLFFFGLGLGIPLLLIGTFSGSLNMLPKAGFWMVDIKQFFGFLMLATCFYFLSMIIPPAFISWAFALFCIAIGLFYCTTARKAHSALSRFIKTIIGIALVATSVYLLFNAYKQTDIQKKASLSCWLTDFDEAVARAKKNHQPVLIDISAPYCSMCKAIDKKILCAPVVCDALKCIIPLKIEDIETVSCSCNLQEKFHVIGAPTIILYDPVNDCELKRWGAELYEWEPKQFAQQLK